MVGWLRPIGPSRLQLQVSPWLAMIEKMRSRTGSASAPITVANPAAVSASSGSSARGGQQSGPVGSGPSVIGASSLD